MTTKTAFFALLLSPVLLVPVLAQAESEDLKTLQGATTANEWHLSKYDATHRIKSYQKREDGKSIRSFKLDYIVDANIEKVGKVYLDVRKWTRWWWKVKEAKMIKEVSAREFIFYIAHRAPVANPDRDVVLRATIEPYNAKTKSATLTIRAVAGFVPIKQGHVRMVAEDMVAKFTALDDSHTRVELEGYIDPGGNMPGWSINFIQRQAPYYTALALQRMVNIDTLYDKDDSDDTESNDNGTHPVYSLMDK